MHNNKLVKGLEIYTNWSHLNRSNLIQCAKGEYMLTQADRQTRAYNKPN